MKHLNPFVKSTIKTLLVALQGAGRVIWESQWSRTGNGGGDDCDSMIDVGSIDGYNIYGGKYCYGADKDVLSTRLWYKAEAMLIDVYVMLTW